jgi:long-chain acyl-CoA synthetase
MPSLLSSEPVHLSKAKELAKPPPKGQPHSLAIPNSQTQGRSKVYRHWRFREGLLHTLDPTVQTVYDAFESTVQRAPHSPCLGHRPWNSTKNTWGSYEWIDYETVQQRKNAVGAGLVELHTKEGITGANYGIGLWCQNRPEWQIIDLAAMSQSLYTVSLYDTLGAQASEYIIRHANLACVATSLSHVSVLLKLKPRLPSLKIILVLDPLEPAQNEHPALSKSALLSAIAADAGVKIFSLQEVESIGASLNRAPFPPKPTDPVTVNYTSGTTGDPKGVVLTHGNAIAAISAALLSTPSGKDDVIISYLPLAHIYERLIEQSALWGGARIGYFHGNVLELTDDLKILRPTRFASVPRLFNRFGGAIKAQTVEAPGFKGALSRHVVRTKTANLKDKNNPTYKHALYDRIWGKKVAAALGLDRAVTMVSGSAPLDPNLQQFLQVVFANRFIQAVRKPEPVEPSHQPPRFVCLAYPTWNIPLKISHIPVVNYY